MWPYWFAPCGICITTALHMKSYTASCGSVLLRRTTHASLPRNIQGLGMFLPLISGNELWKWPFNGKISILLLLLCSRRVRSYSSRFQSCRTRVPFWAWLGEKGAVEIQAVSKRDWSSERVKIPLWSTTHISQWPRDSLYRTLRLRWGRDGIENTWFVWWFIKL